MAEQCPFCDRQSDITSRLISRNDLAFALTDGYPVTNGHTLIVPERHSRDFFDLNEAEILAIARLLQQQKKALQAKDRTITGFNIGMNCGESAGQTIFHCHVHLIPRRDGDVANPRGGVRNTIPGKGCY